MPVDTKWSGEWKAVREWIRSLFPTSLTDPAIASEIPCSIEIHFGSRQQLGSGQPARRVDVSDMEAEDAERRVLTEVEEVFDTLGSDRTQVLLQLKPTRLVDGAEKVWSERPNLVRGFSRVTAIPQQTPFRPGAAAGAQALAAAGHDPALAYGGRDRVPAGITLPPIGGLPATSSPSAIHQSWNAAGQGARPPTLEAQVGADSMLRGDVNNQSVWLYLVQHQSGEIRFLIEQCVGMMAQVIGVTDNMARAAVADSTRKGKAVEDMIKQVSSTERDAERERARLGTEAKLAQRETEIRDLELERRDLELENLRAEIRASKAAADAAERLRQDAERRAEREASKKKPKVAAPEEGGGGLGDAISRQFEGAAGQFVQQVVGNLGGALVQGATPAAPAPAQAPEPEPAPAPRTIRRGGVVVTRSGGVTPAPATAPAPATGASPGAFDPNSLTPEQAAFGLMMLSPEKRKAAIQTLTRMNRDLALDIAETAAREVDLVDGVTDDDDDENEGDDETGEEEAEEGDEAEADDAGDGEEEEE